MKKWMGLVLCLLLTLTMTACGNSGNAVYVQRVGTLMNQGGIAPGDRFIGLVVSENVSEIQKDKDKTIAELKVKEGDDVKAGQELFAYDTEELQLNLDKQRLELEQLLASIENYGQQIKELEKERSAAGSSAKLQYTIQIQTTQLDLKEAELKVKSKEAEVAKSEEILANAIVKAPVAGRVQSINESGTDQNGREVAYIIIQQSGAYRIKGTLGELQRGGIIEGDKLRIMSRTNENETWSGTVKLVDYESPIQGNGNNGMGGGMISMMGGSSDEMTSSSKYPFYVELDSTEGLLLGQHVYMELDGGEAQNAPGLSGAFIAYEEDGSAFVWAEKKGKLEKRSVTLGEYNPQNDTYPILGGLTEEDYIAFPNAELCREGAPTTHEYVEPEAAPEGESGGEAVDGGVDMGAVDAGIDMGIVDGNMGAAIMPDIPVEAAAPETQAAETVPEETVETAAEGTTETATQSSAAAETTAGEGPVG